MSFTNSKQQTARKPFRVLMVTGAYPTADDLSDPSAYIYRYVLTYYQSTMSARTISTYMTGWFQITCLVFVNEGSVVIESTSGNLGVALSFFCKLKGYKFVMQGEADALFIAVSTSGTLAGVGRFFREVSPSSSIIGVDAHGSVVFGTPPAPRKLTGMVHPDYPGISREICTMYICL